ncbi:hypothetical protein [Nocardia neocaledoniensis]|uniref:hypothetical protein n=1 Tax=Nocardia neocaledoniensis TaxID=236511 RepID=UPI002456B161|nr:hypothetical protein [Nocardia neocaledoniensis]
MAIAPPPCADTRRLAADDPFWAELFETEHMSHREFVADDSALRATFGLAASDLDDVLRAVVPVAETVGMP